jgi:hypothetical protein
MFLIGFSRQSYAKIERSFNKENNLLELKIEDTTEGFTKDRYNDKEYTYETEDIRIVLFLNRIDREQSTVMDIKNNFDYMDFRLYFPERKQSDAEVYFGMLNPIRKFGENKVFGKEYPIEFDLLSYENNQLRGYIQGRITEITSLISDRDDPACRTDDMMGICYKDEKVDIPFKIDFNIKFVDHN